MTPEIEIAKSSEIEISLRSEIETLGASDNPAHRQLAYRLENCGDPEHPRCACPLLCPYCARRRATSYLRDILRVAPSIESAACKALLDDAGAVESLRRKISRLRKRLSSRGDLGCQYPEIGLTDRKKQLRRALNEIAVDLGELGSIRTDASVRDLKAAKATTRYVGEVETEFVIGVMDRIRDALRWQSDHDWRVLWLTMPDTGKSLAEDVGAAKIAFSQLWTSWLSGPHTAAFTVVEIGNGNGQQREGNIHLNIVYFGPRLPFIELQTRWVAAGGGSIVRIEKFRFGRDESLTRLIYYFLKFDPKLGPDLRVAFWQATRGKQLVKRLGGFARRRRGKGLLPIQGAVPNPLDA